MSNFKGTKGKWEINKKTGVFNIGGLYQLSISGNDRKNRQVCNVFGVDEKEGKSNAQLIAHAPEMLEMLELLIDRMEENDLGNFPSVLRVKKLINKATEI